MLGRNNTALLPHSASSWEGRGLTPRPCSPSRPSALPAEPLQSPLGQSLSYSQTPRIQANLP